MKKVLALTLLLLIMFVFCLHGFVDRHSMLGLAAVISTGGSLLWVLISLAINWQDLL